MSAPRKEVLAEGIEIWLGDCRDVLPLLGRVDAVVTDPPYGINGIGQKGGINGRQRGKWNNAKHINITVHDDDKEFDPKFLLDLGIPTVMWGANYFSDKLPKAGWLIWDKRLGDIAFTGGDAEIAYCSTLRTVKIERHLWFGLCRASEVGEHWHPTQKPVVVMQRCIEITGRTGTILDPFMGSGTTGVACVNLGRKFIGIEREPKYFDIARRRINEALSQPRLALPEPVKVKQESLL